MAKIIPGLLTWLRDHNYRVIVDPETGRYNGGLEVVTRVQMAAQPLTLVVVLGGDGTLLSAARVTAAADVPLLGVNLGTLGFLTEVPPSALYAMLEEIAQGRAPIDSRSLMHCDLMRGANCPGQLPCF